MSLWRRCLIYSKITLTLTTTIASRTVSPRIQQLLTYIRRKINYPCRRCSADIAREIDSLFLSRNISKLLSVSSVGMLISATVCATARCTSGLCVLRRLLHACRNIFCQNDSIMLARLLRIFVHASAVHICSSTTQTNIESSASYYIVYL